MCSGSSEGIGAWDGGSLSRREPGRPSSPYPSPVPSPLLLSAARGGGQLPPQPGETGRAGGGRKLNPPGAQCFLCEASCAPPLLAGARATAAAGGEAGGEGESGTGSGKFAE